MEDSKRGLVTPLYPTFAMMAGRVWKRLKACIGRCIILEKYVDVWQTFGVLLRVLFKCAPAWAGEMTAPRDASVLVGGERRCRRVAPVLVQLMQIESGRVSASRRCLRIELGTILCRSQSFDYASIELSYISAGPAVDHSTRDSVAPAELPARALPGLPQSG